MKKYGLQLRFPPEQQKKMSSKPLIRPPASIFGDDDDDDVTKEISRQASKSRALRMIDEQQKKTLEEDPMAFDYDGVYDEMKSSAARARVQDHSKREPKYITAIIETSKKRERDHEIIYERKLLKERSKDDHMYEDKEKFVTSAYKQKLAERARWLEEERLSGLREEKEDVTKKSDLTDFYFSLNKNVAFGAQSAHSSKPTKEQSNSIITGKTEVSKSNTGATILPKQATIEQEDEIEVAVTTSEADRKQNILEEDDITESFKEVPEDVIAVQATGSEMDAERFKRSEDAVAAARERFLARKKAREQQL